MANSKKRISELPALSVASLDTTFVLGISGSTTYKISINNLTSSLDGAFATDLVTNALSSSLNSKLSTSSFNSYTASAINGTISGSSQLTSSFDQRYTLSGSIPNIPTGSFATTGSNTFNGDMTLISSSNIILRAPGADGPNGAGDIVWQNANGGELARLWNASDSNRLTVSFTGSHNSYVFGTLIHSLNLKEFGDDHFILTSSFNSYTASQSTSSLVNRLNAIESVSGSWITESETGSFLTSLSGAISSSTQISDLGFVTGSYTTINSFNSLTQSFNSISQSFNVISGSVGGIDFTGVISGSSQVIGILSSLNSVSASLISKTGSYATTGSNTFYGDQIMVGNPSTQRVELSVGETYGGGKVFKILSGSYALIVDMNDLGAAQAQYMQVATNATSTTGSVNQSLILARSGSTPNAEADINNPARGNYGLDMEDPAVMAFSSSIGGYNDWYIPSTTEIAWINQGVAGRLYEGFSVGNYYWTSNYAGSPYTYYTSDGQGRTDRVLGNVSNGGSTQHPVVAIRKINQSYREVITTDNTNISITGSLSVSGSITGSTNFNTIVNKPTLISGSQQITTFGFVSGSYETTGRGIISSSANLVTTSSFNSYTASISTASLVTSISNLNSATSSYLTSLSGAISSSSQITTLLPTGVVSGSAQTIANLPTGLISGSSQLTSAFPSKTTGTWSVPANASTQSFTVEAGASYTMWVNGNIPNGIITWNATVTTSNTNVPVVGSQHGWYYSVGNALVLTSMPDQITGTNGSIVNTPAAYAPNTSNVFKFGITNNSGASQTINYGYIKLS